jgi:hypothetical protein
LGELHRAIAGPSTSAIMAGGNAGLIGVVVVMNHVCSSFFELARLTRDRPHCAEAIGDAGSGGESGGWNEMAARLFPRGAAGDDAGKEIARALYRPGNAARSARRSCVKRNPGNAQQKSPQPFGAGAILDREFPEFLICRISSRRIFRSEISAVHLIDFARHYLSAG